MNEDVLLTWHPGETGLDGTTLLPKPTQPYVRDPPAIIAMRDALLAQPAHTAWVVATGTLTNVALLFAAFPDVAEHVAGLSIMGASVGNGFTPVPISRKPGDEKRTGNITPYAEFNVYVGSRYSITRGRHSVNERSATQKLPNLSSPPPYSPPKPSSPVLT